MQVTLWNIYQNIPQKIHDKGMCMVKKCTSTNTNNPSSPTILLALIWLVSPVLDVVVVGLIWDLPTLLSVLYD